MKKFQVRHSEIQQLRELKNHGQPVSIVPKVKVLKSSRIFYYKFITWPSTITSWYKRNVSLRSHSYQILGSIVGLINWISGCLFFDFRCFSFFLVFFKHKNSYKSSVMRRQQKHVASFETHGSLIPGAGYRKRRAYWLFAGTCTWW